MPEIARVGVQLADERERVRLLDVGWELLADVATAELLRDPAHAALVGLCRVVVADEDGGEARVDPVLLSSATAPRPRAAARRLAGRRR